MNKVRPDLKNQLELQDKKDSQYVLNRGLENIQREVIKQEKRKESTLKQRQEAHFHGMRGY